ncbi:uncharacterized protein LOC109857760 [Pseudomyrmex gracilis]|uniref:uncharacterized protein LOC109857760 n=1 Tax=Pseudomyrmex gracilis TaxID=219809 RepID=UPI0009956BE8|nr:uncharacterized protein LOC109857760 [Pseudomyrmex gracilis]
MMCDARTCAGCRYLEQDYEQEDDRATILAEFLANCQHAKCKVVRLVRQQISKLQNMQYERFLIDATKKLPESMTSTKVYEEPFSEVHQAHRNVHEPCSGVHDGSYGDVREIEGEVVAQERQSELMAYEEAPKLVVKRMVEVKDAVEESTATASLPGTASPERAVDRKWMLRILDRVRHRAHLILAAAAVGVIVWTALVYGVFLGATACGSGRTCFASSFQDARRSLF